MVQSTHSNHHNIWCACLFFRTLRPSAPSHGLTFFAYRIHSTHFVPSRSLPPPSAAQPLPYRSSSSRLRQNNCPVSRFTATLRFTRKTPGCFSAVPGRYFSRLPVCSYTVWSFLLSILPMTHIPHTLGYPPLRRYGSRGLTMALPPRS